MISIRSGNGYRPARSTTVRAALVWSALQGTIGINLHLRSGNGHARRPDFGLVEFGYGVRQVVARCQVTRTAYRVLCLIRSHSSSNSGRSV